MPVKYVVLADHLDMIGVKLTASYQNTRKINGDDMTSKIQAKISSWKSGRFMQLINRPYSINLYCLSKVLFKCSSLSLRSGDCKKINTSIRSFLFADQLEKPPEHVVIRPRKLGGLGVAHVKSKPLLCL